MDRTFAPPPPPAPDTKGAQPAPARKRLDLLVRMAQQAGGAAVDRIQPRTDNGPAPLSFGQERLWLVHQLEPSSPAYAVQGAYRMPAVDVAAMERALGELVRRHEALRTTFAEVDGAPVQVVAPFTGFTLPIDDLSGIHAAEREAAAARRMEEEEARPFDLVAGPLFRPRLIRLGGEDILLFFMHHIVSDAWSLGLLFRELGALYRTYENGGESLLPPVNLQYADYAVWQRRQLHGAALERHLGWWRERLAGAPARLDLPTDHPRPAVRSYAGSSVETELPGDLLERLRALAQAEGATLFMVLLGAFQLLLARYTGTEDIVVGSPVEGRSRREVEEIVGFFVNMLVLRTDLSGDPTFREVLRRVRETTLGAYEHQEMPFEKLVAELQSERSLSRSPLFQVVFAAETAARGGDGAAAPGQAVELEARTAQYDLVLSTAESARTLHASLNYSTELFDRPTMERMLGHLRRVLEQVVAEPDRRLSRLELAGAEERALVIHAWNQTACPFPRGVCIHELFEAQVRERPDAAALLWGDARLTYAELDARANRLAHHLRGLGVAPDHRVGVMLERGVEMIVSLLAILKAGGCYVPLDAGYPAERLALMLADGGVRVVVSHGALASVLAEMDVRVVCVDDAAESIAAESAAPVRSGATAENLAYIVYTSGSTGKPKGVMVAHRHVVQLVCETDYVRLGPGDRVAQASNASFDALTFEAWGALLNGATLVGIPRDVLLSTAEFGRVLREQGITTLYQTTALVNQLSREMPDIFAPLREVLFGGQAVDADSVRRLLKAGKPRRLLHMYGPTETTAWCSWEPIDEVAEGALTVSVGRPTGNQRIYLLDGALNPVPVGVPGEAYVGGDGVVRGYLERPALTAERFVPDPFAAEPGARMYRTGDRLRWKADGRLEFVGRVDDQVKIRGFRIEPGEVESVLSSHPDVRGARVIVREDAPGEKRLVAYVVGGAEPEAMRAHLRRTLPEYMVPAAFVAMDSLPLTPNGKLDVKALPAPDLAGSEDRYVAPRTPTEEVLAGVWAEVLGLERVGTADNFFELGGHSLLAARVVSRVHAAFGIQLPLRALFEAPTVAGMAEAVESLRRDGAPAPAPLVPVDRTGPLPMSFAQERLWFLDRLQPGSTTYNMEFPLRLGAAVDPAALERALGEIVRRHESLRTTFAEVDGRAVQVIHPFSGFTLPVEDLSALDADEREAEMRRRAAAEAARPFDLVAGPVFRATLLRLGAEDVLLLTIHHIASDGWSMGVLFRELAALYEAYRNGEESVLAPLHLQYADFAVWQRAALAGEALERQLDWWRERLEGAPALLDLPTDRPRPPALSSAGASVAAQLPRELLERLRALARAEGATLYMVLLGAFNLLLSRYAGSEDVVVGSPVAGRTHRETEGLIGFFVNTLVMRTDLSGDPGFRALLRRVRETVLGAYEHQDVPLERLVAELQPERSLSRSPLFQVVFAADTEARGGAAEPGRGIELETRTAVFDLTLSTFETADALHATLNYSTELWERPTMERMLGHLRRVLEQVCADADAPLSRIDLLTAAERAEVLDAWNRTARPYPRGACIHDLFAAQVRERPDAPALVWGDERLTYAELDARASRLARHLRGLGVGPESRVGVLLERGTDLIVSLLAVLKAGGCYVPLDPAYPAERLALMLADSGARVLVARGATDPALAEAGARVVCLDADAEAIAAECAEPVRSGATVENLAYIVYTSGSTGRPKGVMVGHRQVVQLVRETDFVRLEPGDRVAQASNASFDALTFEAWGALLNGATLVGIPRDVLLSPPALRDALRAWGVTTLFQTTELFNQLTRECPDVFATLREVLFGGQAVDAERVRRILGSGAPRRLLHVYGPTETTTFCLWEPVRAVAPDAVNVPIGGPTGNARVYLLDPALQPVPRGVPGEAYVGGAGVARGYLDRPALTAERFLPDPFAAEPGGRMYRTGDRMRWNAAGRLEFLGRLDEQVKVRGFRIEPGEVENALSTHPSVRGARVLLRRDGGEARLVAYVVGQVDADALRAHLRRTLPEYMLPAAFVALDAMPVTPNGKVDVRALPAPELASAEDAYVAPRTPVEEVLAEVWAEVLGAARVGVEDDFFAAGGHSLLAMRVASRVREVFGMELPLRALFEGPTVAQLAVRVEEHRRAGLPAAPPVVPVERTPPLPLSFAQERLWFLDRMRPGSTTYNMYTPLRLGGALDAGALERALGEVVRRHESLRTTFADAAGTPMQVIAPFAGFALPIDDLSQLDAAAREAEVRRRVDADASAPFDLATGPLFRAALLRLADEEHVLLLSMHHVVSDGWSMGVLFRELSALYRTYRNGEESVLAPLDVQYADYAVWQRERLRGEALERQIAWWRERLAGAPALLDLSTDHPRPAVQTYRGAVEPVELPASVANRLRALGRSEGATMFMVLLAAFQVLLSRHGGGDDVVVGTPVAGRTQRETEELIGFFVNTLALRTDLSGDPSFAEVLRRVRETTLGAYEHQDLPFEKLVAELQPERSLSYSPFFQVTFTLEDGAGGQGGIALDGVRTELVEAEDGTTKVDLALALAVDPRGGLTGELAYRPDLWERSTAVRMLDHLGRVLEQVAADPGVRLSRLDLLGADERRRVVEEWNPAESAVPGGCIHELFAAQAARTPDAEALRFAGRGTTYRQLDEAANRLAHQLAARGAGPEVRVGIVAERVPETVVALLAVLKAGGAYVPLDPAYPAERLRYMLADSGARLVIVPNTLPAGLDLPGIVDLRAEAAAIAACPASVPRIPADPEQLAYVVYTSGSTGQPKGVAVAHRGVPALAAWKRARLGQGAHDRALQFASLSFDAAVEEVFGALLNGGTLVMAERDALIPSAPLRETLRREGVTFATLPPAVLALMDPADAPSLRVVVSAGEALPPAVAARWAGAVELHNAYGPTEATVSAASGRVAADGRVPVIGRPLESGRAYVLDAAGSPVPVGVPGELYLGGAGVARGYLNRPSLTAERFVPDPFSAAPGARLYRTGDRARWREEGTLEYLGRLDGQVKVRGFRIEPGEVEAVLHRHPGVADCAVVPREDVPGERRLVAYVAGGVEAEVLRAHLRGSLPDYMVPAAFVVMERLPRTPNGKLDARALPAPAALEAGRRLQPETEMEGRVAAVWREVLSLEAVGVEDNFFDLGGHSLLLVRMQARLAGELGRELPVVELFQYPTIRSLAGWLQGNADSGAAREGEARGGARQAALSRLEARRQRMG